VHLALRGLGLGERHGVLGERLFVVAVLEAPPQVLIRGLVQMLLNVVEGVLRHVGNTRVGVLPHRAL